MAPLSHPNEPSSDVQRLAAAQAEPRCLRTYTPSELVIARSAGCCHFTPEGRRRIDFTSGVLVANLGHNPRAWLERVIALLGWDALASDDDSPFVSAAPLTSYNAITPLETEASQRLVDLLQSETGGARLEQVLWAASGSEAIQKALWAALRYREGADVILASRRGFHGKKGLAGAVTGDEHDPDRDPRVRFIRFPIEECIDVDAQREPHDLRLYEQELERCFAELGQRICCVITEPYLGGGGSYHPRHEYLQLLQRYCRRHDALLILDEIQSNFGRTGEMFAFTTYGIEPDLVCLGKGLGNGAPVAAAVGRRDVFAKLPYGAGSDTYSGNPFSCAAVIATLEAFADGAVLEHARGLAIVLESGLRRLAESPAIAHVRGEGTVWGVQCAAVGERTSQQTANDLVRRCYLGDDQGRAVHLLGPLAGDVIRVAPPLVMSADEANEALTVMHWAATQCAAEAGASA